MRAKDSGRATRHLTIFVILGCVLTACGGSEPPPPVALVELTPPNDTILIGGSTQLTASLKDEDGNILTSRAINWTSGSPTVASISQTGLVTGVADGTALITATSEGRTGSATIRVFNPCSTELAPLITVGQTVTGALSTTDCKLTDNTYADGYSITVSTATNVQIDMTASSFDTYLVLLELLNDGSLVQRAFNDDVDPDDPANPNDPVDTNSRITFALQPNLAYFILANSFDENVTGNYQLKVAAAAFVGTSVVGKPGKAPIASLIKALKPPK